MDFKTLSMGEHDINELNAILRRFSVATKSYAFQSLNKGLINDTFLVVDGSRPVYILQRINQSVFKDIGGLMRNIHIALKYLHDADYSKIDIVKTISGSGFYEAEDKSCWRLMTYLEDSTTYNTTEDPKIAFEAGRIIGKFHQLLSKAPPSNIVSTIPKFHDLKGRMRQFKTALKRVEPQLKSKASESINFAVATYPLFAPLFTSTLPIRICHNDTKLNNILFSEKDKNALCLIDLDTIMPGYFYYDFGDAIRSIVNPTDEGETDLDKITFNKQLFVQFVEGLAISNISLLKKEQGSLPLGVVYMPFLHGLRALTDYLQGNTYYKVAYPDHNLDRCLNLFAFTRETINHLDLMQEIISDTLRPGDM